MKRGVSVKLIIFFFSFIFIVQMNSHIPNKPDEKTARVQAQVNEVVNIMQENIEKVMQRGERLDDLREKTEDLEATAGQFKRGANQARKRMWWKDLKWKIIIALTVIVILAIIIGSIVGTTQAHHYSF